MWAAGHQPQQAASKAHNQNTKSMSLATTTTTEQQPASPLTIASDSLAFGIAFAIGLTVVQRGVGFLRGVLFCRIMTDQELGQWSLVFSFLMLLAPLAVLGLPGCFGRFVEHYLRRQQLGFFVRRIATISALVTLTMSLAMLVSPEFFSRLIFGSSAETVVVNAMAFALIMVSGNNFLSSLMEALRQIRLATIMRFVTGISFALAGTGLLLIREDGASAATFGFGVAALVGLVPAIPFLWKYRRSFSFRSAPVLSHQTMWSRIAPFAFWLWATNLVFNMFEVSDRMMLIHWSAVPPEQSQSMVGQYHSARVLPLLLVGVGVVLEGMLLPYMTALWESGKKTEAQRQIRLATKSIAVGFTLAGIGIVVLSPLLFDRVFSGRYADGHSVLPLTLVYCTWISVFTIGQTWLWVCEKGKWVVAVMGLALGINLLANALLIPHFGLWGAVIATSTASLTGLLLTQLANHRTGLASNFRLITASFIPLLLLLPGSVALTTAFVALIAVCWGTTLVFSQQEKLAFLEVTENLRTRFGGNTDEAGTDA